MSNKIVELEENLRKLIDENIKLYEKCELYKSEM
jgi:hypothetical protein